jgi:hypothetical protein
MKPGRAAPFVAALALGAFCVAGHATSLYTFGGDFTTPGAFGVPDSLNRMDPASAASVTNVQTPVGDTTIGFNGGLVFAGGQLYAVGNDSNGLATLYSFQTNGLGLTAVSTDFNTSGDAAGVVFQNGLTADGSTFYAIGAGPTGEGLYQIGAGSATFVQGLTTLGGTYAGLAWDPTLSAFYAIITGATGSDFNGDFLVRFSLGGPVNVLANLTTLDGAEVGTHLGGLADAGGGVLFDIFTNPATFSGQLEQITVGGSVSTSTLYDTQIPLAENAGIAIAPDLSTPEPTTSLGIGAGLVFIACRLKRRKR